jgi:hypothetical protein
MPHLNIPDPEEDYAHPELRALLDQGIEPLKHWILHDLVRIQPDARFHATTSWDDNVLACYLAKFLPRLPPTSYYFQDVIVIHLPQHWQNASYNRIFTQCSGNCLIPDDFHQFLLHLTHNFGNRPISPRELASWLEHGKAPDVVSQEKALLGNERLVHSLAQVEMQLEGTVDLSTVHILTELKALEWIGLIAFPRREHDIRAVIYVKGDLVLKFDHFQSTEMAVWFDEMRARGSIGR